MTRAGQLQMVMDLAQVGAIPPELLDDVRLMFEDKPPWWRPLARRQWRRAQTRIALHIAQQERR